MTQLVLTVVEVKIPAQTRDDFPFDEIRSLISLAVTAVRRLSGSLWPTFLGCVGNKPTVAVRGRRWHMGPLMITYLKVEPFFQGNELLS